MDKNTEKNSIFVRVFVISHRTCRHKKQIPNLWESEFPTQKTFSIFGTQKSVKQDPWFNYLNK